MANSPVDRNASMMQEDFGTKVLITDPAADKLLAKASQNKTERDRVWRDDEERMH